MSNLVEDVAKAYFAALRKMDVDAWVALFADDAISHDPVGAAPHVGKADIRQFLTDFFALFDTVGLTEVNTFIAGDHAAVKWDGRGVGKARKNDITFEGIDVIFVGGSGLIRSVHAYWDPGPTLDAAR
jgi:ketosteroid isomerase-like protein